MEERKPRTKVTKQMEDCYYRADEVAKYLSMGLSTVWDNQNIIKMIFHQVERYRKESRFGESLI